jgi:hypothetical protein
MLASQARGNFERIRTWRGTYSVRVRQHLSAEQAAAMFGAGSKGKVASPQVDEIHYRLDFAIDIAADAIYRSNNPIRRTRFDEVSKQATPAGDFESSSEKSVVTAEHL